MTMGLYLASKEHSSEGTARRPIGSTALRIYLARKRRPSSTQTHPVRFVVAIRFCLWCAPVLRKAPAGRRQAFRAGKFSMAHSDPQPVICMEDCMTSGRKAKLTLQLTDDQLKALRPLMEATGGSVKLAGTVEGKELSVSFIACNAAFLACNAAFTKVQ